MTHLITGIMLLFFILGALDYIIGNRYGLGEEFENGIMASGRLFLCMSGFMVIAPLIAKQLGPVIAPAFRMIGADPSAFAGLLLANDAGGAALAMELADTDQAGLFNGLVCGVVESMTGYAVFSGIGTLDIVFPIVGGIAVFLVGAFPLLKVIRKIFAVPLLKTGKRLGINDTSTSALLMALANGIPSIMMLHDMDDKGRILNVAFLSSAACVLGDHLAFTSQVAPELCASVVTGKLVGGITALAVALVAATKFSESTPCPENIGECDSQ